MTLVGAAPRRGPVAPDHRGRAARQLDRLRQWYGSWAGPWLLVPFLTGLALRVTATLTYWPGVDFLGDSYDYLANARDLRPDMWHPLVYPLFLHAVSWIGPVGMVAVVQTGLGLLTGVLVYRLARRLGLGDAGAALAAAPVLLDAWQLALEQIVMAEALFEVLLTGALVLLLPRGPIGPARAAVGGLLLSLATLTRTVALPVAALLGCLLLLRRVGWKSLLAAGAAIAMPVLAYASAFAATYGPFALQGYSGRQVYGVAATVARCSALPHDAVTRALCPATPLAARAGNNQYTWDASTPLKRVPLHARTADDRVLEFNGHGTRFAHEVFTHQPMAFARTVLDSTARYFTVGRRARLRDYPQVAWQFLGTRNPAPVFDIRQWGADFRGNRSAVPDAPFAWSAGLLRAYQRVAYTPGPVLGLALAVALVAALRRRRLRSELLVLSLGGLGVLVLPSIGAGFDYRYVLTALLLLPTAGLLGVRELRERSDGVRTKLNAPRVVVRAGTLALVGLAAWANAAGAGLMPAAQQRVTTRMTALGETATLRDGLEVTLGAPTSVVAKCRQVGFQSIWWWATGIPVQVRTTGPEHLLQAANLAGRVLDPWFPTPTDDERGALGIVRTKGPLESPAVLSARYPAFAGVATMFTDRPLQELRYTDPGGAGSAAWPYQAQVRGLPAPGSLCDEPGVVLRGAAVAAAGTTPPDPGAAFPAIPGPERRAG